MFILMRVARISPSVQLSHWLSYGCRFCRMIYGIRPVRSVLHLHNCLSVSYALPRCRSALNSAQTAKSAELVFKTWLSFAWRYPLYSAYWYLHWSIDTAVPWMYWRTETSAHDLVEWVTTADNLATGAALFTRLTVLDNDIPMFAAPQNTAYSHNRRPPPPPARRKNKKKPWT